MTLLIFIVLLCYIILIIQYRFGWDNIKKNKSTIFTPTVSVVISIRNEENKIVQLLKSLQAQIYPKDKLEFILVNDHSTDNSLSILKGLQFDQLKIIDLPDEDFGKKNAIKKAVSVAGGEIILASDADCIFSPNWVQVMVRYFDDDSVKLVSGPVIYHKKQGFFQSIQTLEFISLISSGAGAIGIGNAIFCNGANMAYRKNVFIERNIFFEDSIASGDDVFLLHSVKSKYPNSITFAKDERAIVFTDGEQNFNGFINQRKRWASKSTRYKDIASIYASYIVLFVNLSIVSLLCMSFFNFQLMNLLLVIYLIKYITDIVLLYPALKFFKRQDLIKWIFPFELFYSFYIVLIALLSVTNKFEWKGRIHNK
tara:strand:- start:31840 stop:32943 length:1104 start_codon:yes stop_codon:yes gene_type:complete